MSRHAYALDQFVGQVLELYPDAEVEYSDPDGLEVVRGVTFDAKTTKGLAKLDLNDRRIITSKGPGRNARLTVVVAATSPLADDRTPFDLPEADNPDVEADGGDGSGDGKGETPPS